MTTASLPKTKVVSDECCTSERNRSSLARIERSASSFFSIVAPAMRITNITTKAPMTPSAIALVSVKERGSPALPDRDLPDRDADASSIAP